MVALALPARVTKPPSRPNSWPWSAPTGPRLFAHRGRVAVSLPGVADPDRSDDPRWADDSAAATLQRDRVLLERWRTGDAEAGVTLLDHYAAHVRRVASRLGVRDPGDFEDFWQDLVLRLVQQLPVLHERVHTSFPGFLAWQVRDLVRNWRRRQRRAVDVAIEASTPVADQPGDRAAFWEALTACSGHLPPRELAVFEHRFLGGLDLGEVAARVGSNANAVAQAVFRLVRRLRDCLATKGFDGPGDWS